MFYDTLLVVKRSIRNLRISASWVTRCFQTAVKIFSPALQVVQGHLREMLLFVTFVCCCGHGRALSFKFVAYVFLVCCRVCVCGVYVAPALTNVENTYHNMDKKVKMDDLRLFSENWPSNAEDKKDEMINS